MASLVSVGRHLPHGMPLQPNLTRLADLDNTSSLHTISPLFGGFYLIHGQFSLTLNCLMVCTFSKYNAPVAVGIRIYVAPVTLYRRRILLCSFL